MPRPPFYYDHINRIDGMYTPSQIKNLDNATTQFYARYFLQRAISVFEWTVPEYWALNYMLYCIYCDGFVAIINTDKYGTIPQGCGLEGYDIFYQPKRAVVTNPLLRGLLRPVIDVDCTLLRLQPDYGGIMDIVRYYAVQMALAYTTLTTNLINSKLAYLISTDNKADAETMKKTFDEIQAGVPAVCYRRKPKDDPNTPDYGIFNQSLRNTYIANDVINTMRSLELAFDRDIGIPTVNESKKERLVSAEIERNNLETQSRCSLWLQELQRSCEKTHTLFGLTKNELWVDWRKEDIRNAGDIINPRSVSVGQNYI